MRSHLYSHFANLYAESVKSTYKEAMESIGSHLMQFKTGDPDEFADKISGLAPGLSCKALNASETQIHICAAQLPSVGIFRSTLKNFRVQSPGRSFYGITIPLKGSSRFLVNGTYESFDHTKMHVQHPDREFDAGMGKIPFDSLQLCFEREALDSMADKVFGMERANKELLESIDLTRPSTQSFVRHALFIWSEIVRGGSVVTSPLIAKQSADMLGAQLLFAANPDAVPATETHSKPSSQIVRRAENHIMANLTNPISVADVAGASGMSARTVAREFHRHHGCTVKEFIKQRRLEAANRILLTATSGVTNVTKVALDFGFDQLGRFSAGYKQAFGELPSETLNR